MRISDWSSDVCSSRRPRTVQGRPRSAGLGRAPAARHPSSPDTHRGRTPGPGSGARKSVVYGKSVSVRVDLGGRRLIKTKHTSNITRPVAYITSHQTHCPQTTIIFTILFMF